MNMTKRFFELVFCQFPARNSRFTPLVFFRFWSIIYENEGTGEVKMKRITLKALAEQSGFSQRTLFRILRNDPQVKASTRDAVIHLLNIHGYMVQSNSENEKIVVDVSFDNLYSEQIARKVFKRLQQENYETVLTNSLRHPATLRKELEDADAVVFSGLQRDDWFRIARDINPSIYRVSLFGENAQEAELHISADNVGGARLAADFLCRNFGRIAVFTKTVCSDSAERSIFLHAIAKERYPQVRCDLIHYEGDNELPRFYAKHKDDYDAYFYQNGTPWVVLDPLLERDKSKIFRLMFNDPKYIREIRALKIAPKLDAYIDFDVDRLQDFVAFYLRNRPLLREPHIITLLPTRLVVCKNSRNRNSTKS